MIRFKRESKCDRPFWQLKKRGDRAFPRTHEFERIQWGEQFSHKYAMPDELIWVVTDDEAASEPEDDLSSEEGVDYRKLRDLLKAGKWKEADQETDRVMCQATDRQQEGWLRIEDIQQFPCADLRTIDQLWMKYTNGHFGFSVQRKIWQECGSPTSSGKDWDCFCVRVGWKNNSEYVSYSDLQFNPGRSFEGELPSILVWIVGGVVGVRVSSIAQRLVSCSTSQS